MLESRTRSTSAWTTTSSASSRYLLHMTEYKVVKLFFKFDPLSLHRIIKCVNVKNNVSTVGWVDEGLRGEVHTWTSGDLGPGET